MDIKGLSWPTRRPYAPKMPNNPPSTQLESQAHSTTRKPQHTNESNESPTIHSAPDIHSALGISLPIHRLTSLGAETIPLNSPLFHGGTPLHPSILGSGSSANRSALPAKYLKISRPVPMMRHEYDVVVVGSGYGGAVAASRMARANKSVCLLELGKERWPGDFPSEITTAMSEIRVSGQVLPGTKIAELDIGNRQGLYHVIAGQGQTAFVANGGHFSGDCD
jgi:hypothetical protein